MTQRQTVILPNGQQIDAPVGVSKAEIKDKAIRGGLISADAFETLEPIAVKDSQPEVQQEKVSYDEDDLRVTPEWIQASKVIYRMNEGNTAEELLTDKDYANYGLDFMGWFNSNSAHMTVNAHRIKTAKPEHAEAMLYLMDTYTNKQYSWEGTGRFFKGALVDPFNLTGLGTLGLGFVASKSAGVLARAGVRQSLVEATKAGVTTSIQGANIAALDNYNRQVVENAVTGGDIDTGEVATSALLGGAVGFGLGTSAGYIGARLGQRQKAKKQTEAELEAEMTETRHRKNDLNRAKRMGEEANAKVKEEIKVREEVAKKAEVKPEDTRGKGQQYHGTSTELGEFGEGHDYYSSMNIYGQGFYTTDALDVAGGYSKKGKGGNPTKYKVIKTNEANLYDLDKPLDDEALKMLSETTEFGADWLEDMAPNPTVRDVFDELRDWSAGEGVPADEVQEMFDSFRFLLEQKGYQGYTHVGGGFTSTKAHKVEIFWNPKDHVRLEKIEEPKVTSAQPKVSTEALDVGSPNTPAGRTITALNDLQKRIAELTPDGKVVGLTNANVQKYRELTEAVEPLKQILKEAGEEAEPIELLEHFEKFEMTIAQMNAMKHLVQRTASDLGDVKDNLIKQLFKVEGKEYDAVYTQVANARNLFNTVAKVDLALASNVGRELGIRKLSKHKGDVLGVTVKDLQKEGYTESQAMQMWSELWEQSHVKAQRDNRVVSLKKRRDKAEARGNVAEFSLLQNEIDTLVEEIRLEELYKKNPIFGRMGEYFNKSMSVTAEVMVSNVFSPSSVAINLVPSIAKSIYQPILDRTFQHGISKTAFKSAIAEYTAMYSVLPSAAKMARTAWDLERSMLTGDSSKFLEDQTHIPKWLGGGVLRVFPRLMLASDAFFEQVFYRGHIAGQAAGNAVETGMNKGLKGKALDKHIKERVDEAVKDSYEPIHSPMGVLRADGKSKGLKGAALDKHIEEGLEKYATSFVRATDEGGIDYTQRNLFKREPSGKNAPSAALKWYEGAVKSNPWVRVIGQLFTRTPVRVFEEGIRKTPLLQFVHPTFANDLAGVNGNLARVRAQRDVFVGQAITAWLFTKFVAGKATGQQSQDYKQGRQVEDAGLVGDYNIELDDGSSVNFRNLDPFSTPMKIQLNALQRYEELLYRQSQGEYIDDTEFRKAEQWMSVGLGSIVQAVRDANLTSGANEAIKLVEGLAQGKEDVAMKFMGQIATRTLPNSWYKISLMDDPQLNDPKSIEQYLVSRINPQSEIVNKQHTALGQIRTSKNPIGGLIPLTKTTVEERKRGLSETQAEAEEWLLHVAQVGNRNFAPPATKNPSVSYEDLSVSIKGDLGKMLTTNPEANAKYGQETMYNRWMRYYRDTNPAEAVLETKGYALGTASNPNEVETMTSEIVNRFRAIGFLQLMVEEPEIETLFYKGLEQAEKDKAGMNYQENTPITGNR